MTQGHWLGLGLELRFMERDLEFLKLEIEV